MKNHIAKEDVSKLNESQKLRLNELWLPQKYDVAVAYICKDAEEEEYDEIEFVIGDIRVLNNRLRVYDLRYLPDTADKCCEGDDELDEEIEVNDDEELFEDVMEEEFDFSYQRPVDFSKIDCVPLLSIGQMIEILAKNSSKSVDFYMLVDSGEIGFEAGSNNYNLSGFGSDFDSPQLCDVLWECIKKIL
ncbi:UNVERIFIED_CONTAM: hypothetical protein Cloal_2064 [Acetivibrio alkalicellulosi]